MNEIAIQPITRPELISDQTYESIRQLIINCQLQPGVPFVEADVARRLGISRSPLREAVRRLEEEGFIETLGRAPEGGADHCRKGTAAL